MLSLNLPSRHRQDGCDLDASLLSLLIECSMPTCSVFWSDCLKSEISKASFSLLLILPGCEEWPGPPTQLTCSHHHPNDQHFSPDIWTQRGSPVARTSPLLFSWVPEQGTASQVTENIITLVFGLYLSSTNQKPGPGDCDQSEGAELSQFTSDPRPHRTRR